MTSQHSLPDTTFEQELHGDILKTVAYFDLFEYPLTAEQIFSFLPRNSVTAEHVAEGALQLVSKERLLHHSGFFFLPSDAIGMTLGRMDREQRAKKLLSFARHVSRFIKHFPFIRGIFITGSLSKNVADASSDIDFMIVTAPERLWISRTMLTLFRKIFLLGNSKFFCTNYYVTEKGLSLDRRNFYTAVEVITTKVLWNEELFRLYQRENSWSKQFLPNSTVEVDEQMLIAPTRSLAQRLFEFVLRILPLRFLDQRLMEFHRTHWHNTYSQAGEEQLKQMFIISPDISASWPDDRQMPVLTRFREKISQLGLQ